MKLVLALALSLPALAGAMGMATREPMDSQTNEAPNGQYAASRELAETCRSKQRPLSTRSFHHVQ